MYLVFPWQPLSERERERERDREREERETERQTDVCNLIG